MMARMPRKMSEPHMMVIEIFWQMVASRERKVEFVG